MLAPRSVVAVLSTALLQILELHHVSAQLLSAAPIIPQISYVIESFEEIDPGWFFNYNTVNDISVDSQDFLFGNHSLFVNTSTSVDFGWLQAERTYSCHGAEFLSVWYKVLIPAEEVINEAPRLQLSLYQDTETLGNRENYTSYRDLSLYQEFVVSPAISLNSSEEDWQELRISLTDEEVNLSSLQLHRIRGWRFQLLIGDDDDASNSASSSSILIDNLSCQGGGQMFGNSFYMDDATTWQDVTDANIFWTQYFQSDFSENASQISLNNSKLTANYTVQQVESWGGFVSIYHLTPGQAFYNLSQATDIRIDFRVAQAASESKRVHLRILLADSSDCTSECNDHELWYSFNYVLDDEGFGQIQIPLIGSEDPSSPLVWTGWSGIAGNRQLDTDHIKGFTLEFSIGSGGEIDSYVQGVIELNDLMAIRVPNETEDTPSICHVETEVRLHTSTEGMVKHEYKANRCCETCKLDPDCLYAVVAGYDCFTASQLSTKDVMGIPNTETSRSAVTMFWMDDERRGDFCEYCQCVEANYTIDCRGANLLVVPKTFGEGNGWQPKMLDLRNNSNLVLLGGGALEAIADSLEELWLPRQMLHIAKESLTGLYNLRAILFEDGDHQHLTQNIITRPNAAFGDVCCTPGETLELTGHKESATDSGPTSLTFCEFSLFQPGLDATYVPFARYDNAQFLKELTPTSSFLSEATETAEKCGEACTIVAGCNYYSYDSRGDQTERKCQLLINNGTGMLIECCNPHHYENQELKTPGRVAGLPPRTRHVNDEARVMVKDRESLMIDDSNDYQSEYRLYLGSKPTRGAVWVTPVVISTLTSMEVIFSPSRIVLYDENTTAAVTVRVVFPTGGDSAMASSTNFVIRNEVESCDIAFTSFSPNTEEATIFVDVVIPQDGPESLSTTGIVVVCVSIVIFLIAAMLFYVALESRKRRNDSLWKVEVKELRFAEPPEILGRGTFGLVLAAEYRGTWVAVKRVVPRRAKKSEGSKGGSGSYTNFGSASYFDEDNTTHVSATMSSWGQAAESCNGSVVDKTMQTPLESHNRGSRKEVALRNKLKGDFIREMRHLSKLRHPCITTIMGAVIEHTEPMLVMELMEHGSLYDLLHNETMIIQGETVLPILRDVSHGMRFLHLARPQILHGDLKAANILVDYKMRAKISDFGLSQKSQYVGATGTPYWMAPELLRRVSGNTPASDVFSFGMVLYEVYSRKDPYEGEDYNEVIRLIKDRLVNKRPIVPHNMPDTVQSIMKSCLLEDPNARPTFRTLDQLLSDVDLESVEPKNKEEMTRQRSDRNLLHRQGDSLHDMLPGHLADAVQEGRRPEPEKHDLVTIFFAEIVGLEALTLTLDALKFAAMLDRLYNKFDELATDEYYDIYTLDTVGNAYMCVSNLTKKQPNDHVERIALFATEAVAAAKKVQVDLDDASKGCLEIRAGFHSGPCLADVVGTKNPTYALFGNTVNTAFALCETSTKNRIQCSKASADLLGEQFPDLPLLSRGMVSIRGKGDIPTFWVNEIAPPETTTAKEEPIFSASSRLGTLKEQSSAESAALSVSESDERLKMAEMGGP